MTAIGEVSQIGFEDTTLLGSDYDDTQFMTSEIAPDIIDVNQAYGMGISQVLGGGSAAAEQFKKQGGHIGRTAAEIVGSLVEFCDGELVHEVHSLKLSGVSNEDILAYLDERPKPTITQGLVYMDEAVARSVTEVLVAAKLAPLTRQIGKKIGDDSYWPRPAAGFLEFSTALHRAKGEGLAVDTAVISAGHADFIAKTYDMHGVPHPDIMITDEVVQSLSPHISAERRAKPAPLPMILAKRAWLTMHGQPVSLLRDPISAAAINSRIIYVGDNLPKDGGLADSSHVDFGHIHPEKQHESWQQLASRLSIGSLTLDGAVK